MSEPTTFDITGAIPEGTTVLEASAGTGKTYAIVGLAARLLAQGTPISSMLLVTFSRAATAELRERMRERVRDLVAALDAPTPDVEGAATHDPLRDLLRSGSAVEVTARRENLIRALSDFDASTIATTHTFCNRMLEALGFLGEREMVATIVEDVDDLTDEAALDLYLRGFAFDDAPEFDHRVAVSIARDAVRQPVATLVPEESADEGPAARIAQRRVRFATRVREIVEARKRTSRVRTYDDLQVILHRIITDPEIGEAACRRIRNTFDVVLVDEFQDTDPLQWEIVRRCFHGHRRLILVGDPKQSIYGFRGAEVLSYLSAVTAADSRLALDTNWRSDAALVSSLSALFGGATLGHEEIVVRPVDAARPGSRLPGMAPLRVKVFLRTDFTSRTTDDLARAPIARERVIADVADDVAACLAAGHEIVDGHDRRPVRPGDIAILVRQNKTIEPLQAALAARGVQAVISSGANVFQTPAARHWLWVLRAIEQPSRTDRVRLAALTSIVGWTPEQVAERGDDGAAELGAEFATLGRLFAQGGFVAMSQRLTDRNEVVARVLATEDGERLLTDLIQLSTLCNRHVVETGAGIGGVVEWLAEKVADTSRRSRHEDQSRRLERESAAVQIMTVHASKGLQFPIVYAPFGWDGIWIGEEGNLTYHDENGERLLDVGGVGGPGRAQRLARYGAEVADEELRLLYVALTRAQSQVVVWWAPTATTLTGPLHRLVFGRESASHIDPDDPHSPWTVGQSVPIPDDTACVSALRGLTGRDASIEVSPAGRHPDPPADGPVVADAALPELDVARFDRAIDADWRRTSYSAIIAGAAHGPVPQTGAAHLGSGSEPDVDRLEGGLDDEPPGPDAADARIDDARTGEARTGMPSPMSGLPFGADFGTLVHEVLEYVDTAAPDMRAHVADLCGRVAGSGRPGDGLDTDRLIDALCAVLTTPLGFGDLWSIAPADRLAELDFELPLGPADGVRATTEGATLDQLAELMERYLPPDDPLVGYAQRLRHVPGRRLRGFLTGSIDSVLRTPDGRFVVVDYKTNRLRPGELVVEDFGRAAMAEEMTRSHYPLQALLYSVALHRYLRWRLPGYDPDRHLGVVQYHFVRGMAGPDTPPGCGVFEWQLPSGLVPAISDLLAGSDGGSRR